LVSDGSANVNLPGSGSTWNGTTRKIVFTSSRVPHDEAWMIGENGPNGSETQITSRPDKAVFEASLSPDGQTIVFESHGIDVEDNGVIFTYEVDGSGPYTALTDSATDSRQPVWSPAGDKIVFQRRAGEWDIWTMNTDGSGQTNVTNSAAFDETDPSFSPDGSRIVYSSNEMGGAGIANIFVVPAAGGASTRVTNFSGYDGAPSWSPDGAMIAFESSPGDPDGSAGTTLWVIAAPTGAAVRPPALGSTWQWQLLVDQQHPLNTSYDVDVYDVDMENTSTQQIADLTDSHSLPRP
jgi:TolB protein